MTKEFEALERLAMPDDLHIKECEKLGISPTQDYEIIKQELKELQAIKEAKTSEEIECLLDIKSNYKFYAHNNRAIDYQCSVITQALIKAQEQEKVLEIIKEKGVDVGYLQTCKTLKEYNSSCWADEEDFNKKLTQEEFDLLKRWMDEH